jgi:hypothetical protein
MKPCDHCGDPREGEDHCYEVDCARCGAQGCCAIMVMEEGDEWECTECNGRENERKRAAEAGDMQ